MNIEKTEDGVILYILNLFFKNVKYSVELFLEN